jgi:hypothetical protein
VPQDPKAYKAYKAHKVPLAVLDPLVLQVPKDQQVHKEFRAQLEQQVLQDLWELQALQDHKA